MHVAATQLLNDLETLGAKVAEIRSEAATRFDQLRRLGATEEAVDACVRRARQRLIALALDLGRPDDQYLAREALRRLEIQGTRSQIFALDDQTLFELAGLLVDRRVTVMDAQRWLQERADRAIDKNAVYRFAKRFRAAYGSLRAEFGGWAVVEGTVDDLLAKPLRPLPPHELSDEDEERLRAVLSQVDLQGLSVQLSHDELYSLCRLLADPEFKRRDARTWLERQLGSRVHAMTFRAIDERFQGVWGRLGVSGDAGAGGAGTKSKGAASHRLRGTVAAHRWSVIRASMSR